MSIIYDREKGYKYEEKQYGGKMLSFLYGNAFGRILLRIAVSPTLSKLAGMYYSSSLSKRKIEKFIAEHNVDMSEYEKKEYSSFNDFFTRKKLTTPDFDYDDLVSPADSKLSVFKTDENLHITVKNSVYSIEELVDGKSLANGISGGYCLVFRLSMDDCHRYCFIDSGKVVKKYLVKGKLHTVSSISDDKKVFTRNTRQVSFLKCDNFGDIVCIEVGAMLVGKFCDNQKTVFKKGEEKGFFELGGSTIIILTDENVKIDDDILKQSKKGIETKVKYAQRIGERK